MKIGVGSVVTESCGEMDEKTREERIRRAGNKVVVYVKDVVGGKKLLVQYEDGQKRDVG